MLKKWFLRIFVSLLILISICFLLIFLQQDKLKEKALNGINQKLDSKVSVDGAIDITFFSTFPKVTLALNQVFVADKFNAKDTLAQINKINFTLNPLSLIGESLSIQRIVMQEGKLRLKTFKDGKSNYEILKKQAENNTKGAQLNIEKILLQNIDLIYENEQANLLVNTFIYSTKLSGNFYKNDFDLLVNLDAKSKILKISNAHFLTNNQIKGTFDLSYKAANKCIVLNKNSINIEGNLFNANGDICFASNTINLMAKAEGTNLEKALKLVPQELFKWKGVKGNGQYAIDLKVAEKLNKPKITLDFSLKKGKATLTNLDIKIKDLYVKGVYKNFPRNNLSIKDFALKSEGSAIKGNMMIPNLENLKMNLFLDGSVQSKFLAKFDNEIITFNKGKVDLKDVQFNFNYRKKDSLWMATKLDGEIKFVDLSGDLKEIQQSYNLNADLKLLKQKINVNNLDLLIGKNDLAFSGTLKNALNFFQDNVFGTNDALIVSGNLKSKLFNINDFLKQTVKKTRLDQQKAINITKWLNIEASVNTSVDKMIYQKLVLTDIFASVKSKEAGLFNLNNLKANALAGSAKGNVALRFLNNKRLEVFIDAKLKKINIEKMFASFENFGQQTITNKNIKGVLNTDFILSMSFTNFKTFQSEDLILQANFDLNDGELIQLESLKSLSKFLSLKQLEHIYFSQYQSAISIANREIQLKKSQIKSNLISLTLGGTHTFDNEINYAIKLNLKNLLATKFKKKKTLQKDYVNDIMGGINLFIAMTGTVDNPIIKMDKKSAYKDLQNSLKNEKQNLKDLFKKDKVFFEEEKEFYYENDTTEFIDFEEEN